MKNMIVHPKSVHFMRKILSTLAVLFALSTAVWAQPSLIIPTETVDQGDNFCLEIDVEDFTDILSMDFSLQWDPTVMELTGIQAFGLPGLSLANFNDVATAAADGMLTFEWLIADCTNPNAIGVTLPDNSTIFELCFSIPNDAPYGAATDICIVNSPVSIDVNREASGCVNIGLDNGNEGAPDFCGLISVGVRPFVVSASSETGFTGDLVCVDFIVSGFDDLTSMQFSVNWDCDKLQFQNVIPSENLVNLAASSFGNPDCDALTVSWSFFDPDNPGVDLPDSTVIFQACFIIVGECGMDAPVVFSGMPTEIEVTNVIVEGFEITTVFDDGNVYTGNCNPTGLQFIADCGEPANINDNICVEVSVGDNFQSVSDFSYLMEWNPTILRYTGVNTLGNLGGLNIGDFDDAGALNNGVLGIVYDNSPLPCQTLSTGTPIFEVCFDVVGIGGDSPFNFVTAGAVGEQCDNNNIGIAPTNCTVEVIQPDGVAMNIINGEAATGETTCLDLEVSNFDNITSYQFSLSWEPTHMVFVDTANYNLPEAGNFIFGGTSSGSLSFMWEPSTDYSLPDNTSIFQVCFEPAEDTNPDECDVIMVVDLPIEAEAVNTSSNGNNIGIISQEGEFCVLFPEGFGMDIGEVEGFRLDTVCVPFSVNSFDNIVSADFSINFNPAELEYVSINNPGTWPGLTEAGNFDLTSASVGVIDVSWTNLGAPAIPDSTVVFELCFALSDSIDCFPITISDSPEPMVETLNGTGSLVDNEGEVCINDRFIIEDIIITPASCPEVCDGRVELVVSGGTGTVGTSWEQDGNPQFMPFVAENLCPGYVKFTLFDDASPALVLMDSVMVGVADNQPFATIAQDTVTLGCNPASALLSGMKPAGDQYTGCWLTLGGMDLTCTNSIVVNNLGGYIFRVSDDSTGCIARDTVFVIAPEGPLADAGPDKVWTCANDTVSLDGTASVLDGVGLLWSVIEGNIVEGDETLAEPRVTEPGIYQLRTRILATGCTAFDTVLVEDASIVPDAVAGPDQVVSCGDESITLDGTGSDNDGLLVTYSWFNSNMDLLGEGETLEVIPPQIGEIILIVEEFSSGCVDMDTLQILPDADLPVVNAGEDQLLDCNTDLVTLSGSVLPDTINFELSWNVVSGTPLVPGTENTLMPQADGAGVYELVITNTANNCSASDTVEVIIDTIPPMAEAGEGFILTCNEPCYTLDGTGSSAGDGFQYTWRDSANMVIAMDTLMVEICDPGTYYLEVTNLMNGCSAIDSVQIEIDGVPPQIIGELNQIISCNDNPLTIEVEVTPPNNAYTYEWSVLDPPGEGNIVGPTNMLIVQVDEPGTYQLSVTDPETGCVGINEIVVSADTTAPQVIVAVTNDLNCDNALATLDGTGSSTGVDFILEWSALEGQTPPNPADQIMTDVMESGWYALLVTDTTNGCSALDSVQVMVDTLAPTISIAEPDTINCQTENVTLDASASTDTGADFTAVWTGLDGGSPDPADALITMVSEGGRYELLIRNNLSGCESRDTVEVATDNELPIIVFAEPDSVTCTDETVELDATQSTVNGDFTTSWAALDGNEVTVGADPLTATATGAGQVQLTITLSNGCASTDTLTVASSTDTPVADAGGEVDIECGGTAQIGGPNTPTGLDFTHAWVAINGNITGPIDEAMTTVDQEGSYELTVTNIQNGCIAVDTVIVTLNLNNLEEAMIDPVSSLCEDSTMLIGNLPDGVTGLWTTASSATIETPDQSMTFVEGLQEGENQFTWTLSAPGCENYSSASVSVMVEGAPIAANNPITLEEDQFSTLINLLATVDLGNVSDFSLEIISDPVLGTLDSLNNGEVTYTLNSGVTEGEDTFTFQICNTTCEDLCATASVVITILAREAVEIPVANGITPNGDGMNDALVFDDIINNPEEFKNNEIVIFNRWGDIVYQAKPYQNDWQGTNMKGEELPHGTYYYILRLDISNGDIIRGDVTIIKK